MRFFIGNYFGKQAHTASADSDTHRGECTKNGASFFDASFAPILKTKDLLELPFLKLQFIISGKTSPDYFKARSQSSGPMQ